MSYPQNPERLSAPLKALISLFIVGFLSFSAIWFFLPKSYRLPAPLWQINRVLAFFGIYQRWAPFAPAIPRNNVSGTAVVTLADGTTRLWEFPHPERMSLGERVYRRYWSWLICHPSYYRTILQPQIARYIADQCSCPDNPAEMVALTAHFGWIPPPECFVKRSNLPPPTYSGTFAFYRK